jgi:uncharacterized protein (TIGR03083 family)
MTPPTIDEQIDGLRREGERFAATVEQLSPDDPVPSCPDWSVRDLVHHTGGVHRWATLNVTRGQPDPVDNDLDEIVGTWPDDDSLATWLRDGVGHLSDALVAAPDDLQAFTFLPNSSPRAFWARRQLHETAVHRVDAEQAASAVTPIPGPQAADGIEEMLFGFAARPHKLEGDERHVLVLRTTDTGDGWTVRIGPDGGGASRGAVNEADCAIAAPASDVYLWLWNRIPPAELSGVEGDVTIAEDWAGRVRVRWS